MKGNFDTALKHVLKYEGGYVDHPRDPGGATNRGITIATLAAWRGKPVSKADVKALTVAEAGKIYKAQYWDTVNGDMLPDGLDFAVFDYAVNSGPSRAAKDLQQIVEVQVDGIVGMATLSKVNEYDTVALINAYVERRMRFLRGLKTWGTFGKGWTARVDAVRKTATALAKGRKPTTPTQMPDVPKSPPPAPVPPAKSKSLWTVLLSFLSGSGGLTYLSGIDTWPKVAFAALLLVALGVGLWLVLSGRVKLKRWFELDEAEPTNTLEQEIANAQ